MLALSGGHLSKREKLERKRLARRVGRPRKLDVARSESGRIAKAARKPRETQDEVLAVAMAAPHRRPYSDKRSALAGYAAGRLFLTGNLTAVQLQAVNRFATVEIRYMTAVVGRAPALPPATLERASRSSGTGFEPGDEYIMGLRHSRANMLFALGNDEQEVLARVAVWDMEPRGDMELGALRTGSNALVRLWGLTGDSA